MLLGKNKFVPDARFTLTFNRVSREEFVNLFPEEKSDNFGVCEYFYGSEEDNICNIYVIEDTEKLVVWIHEITHAALSFLEDKSFTSEAFENLSDEEKDEYYHEAVPTMVETLTTGFLPYYLISNE